MTLDLETFAIGYFRVRPPPNPPTKGFVEALATSLLVHDPQGMPLRFLRVEARRLCDRWNDGSLEHPLQ